MQFRIIGYLLIAAPVAVIGAGLYARTLYNVCLALDFREDASVLLTALAVMLNLVLVYWTTAYRIIEGRWWWQNGRISRT